MKMLGFGIAAVASVASLVFVYLLRPTNLGAGVAIAAWLLSPYSVAAYIVWRARTHAALVAGIGAAAVIAAGGLLLLADILFFHPDPQGGIAILFVPVLQGLALLVLLPLIRWWSKRLNI